MRLARVSLGVGSVAIGGRAKFFLTRIRTHAAAFEDLEPEQRKQAWDRTLREAEDYLNTQSWKGGFFIERGMVHINIGSFLFDCATGNFSPVEVPDSFLT